MSYDEDNPYLIYYAPGGSFKVYWQQHAPTSLKVDIRIRDDDDGNSILAYAKELLRVAEQELGVDAEVSDFEHLKKKINLNKRRLHKLEEQQAIKGHSADPSLQVEIEDIQSEIKRLEELKSRML